MAQRQSSALCALHNLIPHVHWRGHDLLGDEDDNRVFLDKWCLSQVASIRNEPVGLLVAFRQDRHLEAGAGPHVYLHRLAVRGDWQRSGIGTALISQLARSMTATGAVASSEIVAQTNDGASNEGVLAFYRAQGFIAVGRKNYPDKVDVVLRRRLDAWPA